MVVDKLKNTNGSGSIALRAKEWLAEEGVRGQVLLTASGVLLGLLLPRAHVYGGLAPFGIGLAAAVSGAGTVLVVLATLMGYLLEGQALRYVAALLAVAGIRWSVGGFYKVTHSVFFAPTVAFLGTVVTGGALLITDTPTLSAVIRILAEGLLSGGFAYFAAELYREAPHFGSRAVPYTTQLSLLMMLSVVLMALYPLEWGGISIGRLVAIFGILLAARCGRTAGGAVVGSIVGITLLLSTPDAAYLAPAYAFGGLLAGMFSRGKKWGSSLVFIAATAVVTVGLGDELQILIGFYEAGAAGLLFLVMPVSLEVTVERFFLAAHEIPEVQSARQAVSGRMEYAARVMSEVSGTVDTVSKQLAGLSAPDLGSVYRDVSQGVCNKCKSRLHCWEQHFGDVMDSFNRLTPHLKQNGTIVSSEMEGFLQRECHQLPALTTAVNAGYREFLVRESAFHRLSELRGVITDQFDSMAKMLEEFAEGLARPEWVDTDTALRVQDALQKEGLHPKEVNCHISERGHMELVLLLNGSYEAKNKEGFRHRVDELTGRHFALPIVEHCEGMTKISFAETPTLRAVIGFSQQLCEGETLCGDAFESFEDGSGRYVLILSDGMGSGGRAAVDGAMAAGLTARLLKAGFGYESTLRMVNTALMAKSEDESLATLDIAVLNLFTGELELLKAGAGVSLLYSNGRISRMDESSLPLGILRELTFARTVDRLVHGDLLILMSDGVSNDGIQWVEELIKTYDLTNGGVKGLSESIARNAHKRQAGEKDDVTVIVAGIYNI